MFLLRQKGLLPGNRGCHTIYSLELIMNQQRGFTLIELVVVIVILGLLAATALPKFIDVTTDARESSVQGVGGGLRAAAALGQAQYVVNGDKAATSISMGGSNVTVLCEDTTLTGCTDGGLGLGGRPDGQTTGIRTAMPDPDGFTVGGSGGVTDAVTYQPTSGGNGSCQAVYTPDAANDPVAVTITNC
ncbi:type II secretion system protein [Thiohalophilus sp.]|uniref:type II secretion system protein n=1 Tax=Thiohalophilus sp. TaxID=3028392 RepID=UPI002ACDE33A|nr:type II secretion system protein [Thiohalophilus sp.]MDZ7661480.1 type II secretion system protein [Thiohalophilus sp.]